MVERESDPGPQRGTTTLAGHCLRKFSKITISRPGSLLTRSWYQVCIDSVFTGFMLLFLTFETSPFLFSALFGSGVGIRSKSPFDLALSGITNDDVDLSVDALKAVTLPLLKIFGVAEEGGLELKVRVEYAWLAIIICYSSCHTGLLFSPVFHFVCRKYIARAALQTVVEFHSTLRHCHDL